MEEMALLRHFSADEIGRLQRGLPSLAQWSKSLLMPFTAHRLRSAAVAWMNRRWFLERGFDLAQETVRAQVTAWLLDEFAWCVRVKGKGFAPGVRTLWADRYGSSDGRSPHGGSGRVATLGCFQAKGVGQTPLVGKGVGAGHSHGCQSLAECLREAIWAEVAAMEFPHRAVPVIAVLDTGLRFSSPDPVDRYDQNVRRGILVRPAVVRPAHAERAPLFKHPVADFVNRQSEDVQRTRDVIAHWSAASRETGFSADANALGECIRAVSEQIAFGQVHRLFSGGYFSSNVSIQGELLDFGNMHALMNWTRAQVHSVVAGLGDEMRLLRPLIGSLAFYFTKYQRLGAPEELARRLLASATGAYERAWRQYSLALFQAENLEREVQDLLHEILRRYFTEQQHHRVKYRFGVVARQGARSAAAWLHDALIAESFPLDTIEHRTLSTIAGRIRARAGSGQLYLSLTTAARLMMPRPSVDRRYLLDTLARAVPQPEGARGLDTQTIVRMVREAVGGARRHWPRLPPGSAVLAQTVQDESSALVCAQRPDGPRTVWLEGICDPSANLLGFGHRFEESDFASLRLHRDDVHWWAMCPAREAGEGLWHAVLPRGEFALPEMDIWYPRPATRWMEADHVQTR